MTSTQQRDELHNKIWKIANEVRGAVDGWDFKQFVLGTLFYRYISENFTDYIEGGDDSVNYAELPDSVITPEIKDDAVKTKGYFIYPSQLFVNVVKTANINPNLNTDLKAIFDAIENSAVGYASEKSVVGLFADFDTTSTRLGSTVEEKNSRLAAVLRGIASLDFGKFEDSEIDIFGDSYEFLINNYAANAGKSGGEFFTPQNVSKLISRLAMHNQTRVNKIYDPAAGSGSLLLQAKRQFEDHIIEDGFFVQEINPTTYNLARMNMFLHNINYDKFKIVRGNTLTDPQFGDEKPFDAIVSNPPYSVNWMGSDDPTLINDDRFAPAGVLAPKSKADFAFVLHALHYLSGRGRAAIVCFPGIFYRGGAEQKIRKYLVDGNYVETIISLPSNLFYGTSIAVNILVLSKHKPDTKIQFIDASGEEFYTKEINNNILDDKKHHIDKIIEIFDKKKDIDYIAKSVDNKIIAENDYNLSVSSYIEGKDTRPKTDIKELNERIRCIVARENELRTEIDEVITELIGRGLIMSKLQELIQKLCPDGVKYKKLGEIVVIKNGKDYKHLAQGHIPVYGSGGIMTYVNEYVYNKPTVLVPRKGSLGNLFYVDTPFWNVDTIFYTEIDINQIIAKYLYYVLANEHLENLNKAGGVPSLTQSILNKVEIAVPPLEVQEEIVRILDRLTKFAAELQAELQARKEQYEYYRNKLLSFQKIKEA